MKKEDLRGMNRRDFVLGSLGAATVMGLAACSPNAAGEGSTTGTTTSKGGGLPEKWDYETEILVVGGGGGGMVAATKAKELGSNVILIEKASFLGGDTALSSQAAQGFWDARVDAGDSIDLYLEDMKNSHWATEKGQANLDLPQEFPLTMTWLETCSEMYDWAEEHGMAWADVTTQHEAWYPQPQWDTKGTRQWAPSGGSLIAVLQDIAASLDLEIMTSTPATDLIVDENGRVVGAWALDADEKNIAIKATKAVILACGGFNANRGMMSRYLPVQGTGYCGGCDGNTGDGHMMAKALGGKLKDMELGTHWMVYDDVSSTTIYNGAVMSYGGNAELADAADLPFILVNFEGERFMAETLGYKWVGFWTNIQPFHMNYFVFDSGETCTAWLETAAARHGGEDKSGLKVYRADTLDELANMMQVPADSLSATVEHYNGLVDAGVDEDFNRSMRKAAKLQTPPFCAIRMRPRHYTTYGGIAIDTQCRVLNETDEPISGLFAAGTCNGSIVEQEGLYYQGGVGQTMTFGYLAAKVAVEEESWGN